MFQSIPTTNSKYHWIDRTHIFFRKFSFDKICYLHQEWIYVYTLHLYHALGSNWELNSFSYSIHYSYYHSLQKVSRLKQSRRATSLLFFLTSSQSKIKIPMRRLLFCVGFFYIFLFCTRDIINVDDILNTYFLTV